MQASADWVARGRHHQWQRRPIDAMLCFRRAVREGPRAFDARYHLGEVLWELGRLPDAIAVWREAAVLAPDLPAAHQALAEALLGTGDVAGARAAAVRVIELHNDDPRAQVIVAIASLSSTDDAQSAQTIAHLLARDAGLLAVPSIAGTLAQLLDEAPSGTARAAIVDATIAADPAATHVDAMPALLLALVAERLAEASPVAADARDRWRTAMLARAWAARDHDALRRVAFAIGVFASQSGRELGQHYAALCERVERPSVPVVWPRRTRGNRLRIVTLIGADALDLAAHRTHAMLTGLPAARFDVVSAIIGGQGRAAADDALPRVGLPRRPASMDARRLAALDADVIVDLVGLSEAAGALLAQRPARSRMTITGLAAPNAAPLIDIVCADAEALAVALERMGDAIEPANDATLDAAALNALWVDAVSAHRQGDRAGARAAYERVIEAQPEFAPAHHLRGVTLREDGDTVAARAEFAAALAASPTYVEARVDAIRAAVDAGDSAAAVESASAGLAASDDPPPALLRAAGSASLAAHDGERAAALFEAALAREPIDGETHYNHGVALQMQRRFADAARAYQRALAFRRDLVEADFNLGVIFMEQGNRDAAIAAFSTVIERLPTHAAAYKHLGELFLAAGRIDAWRANFARFEAHCEGALQLVVHALEFCQYHGEFDRLERYLETLRHERFKAPAPQDLADALEELQYLLLFFDVDATLLHRFAQTYDAMARSVYGEPLPAAAERRAGRVRLGYLSADLRNHVMGKMIWHAVRHHDRERFELFFYSLSAERDEWTHRFESLADRFVTIQDMTERAAAERIAADDLDVLVDLTTHTRGAKPGILALKPARVQITHVASAGTLGLSTVDFKLTDRYADVPESQISQIERLLPMEGCVYPYRHAEVTPDKPFRRGAFGIATDAIVLGAFASALKLSRRCLTLWREVLARLPGARIAFSPLDPAFAPLYERVVAAAGIDVSRIVFVPQGRDDAESQARYALVDLVLDPLPYGGVNGTLEALDMGVPVVTLLGKRHAERTSYSILMNLGVTQTIAHSGREYVDIAVRLATDHAFMREVRAAIRAGLADSALVDMPAHTRHLEAAYLEALRQKVPAALAAATPVPSP